MQAEIGRGRHSRGRQRQVKAGKGRGSVRPISEAQIETLMRQPGIYAMFNSPNPNPNQRGRERQRETEREGDKERQRETKRVGEGEGEGKGKYLWQSLNCDRGHRAKGREIIGPHV